MDARRLLTSAVTAAAVTLGGVLAWGEVLHWRASRRELGDATLDSFGSNSAASDSATPGSQSEAVVVLGYKNAGNTANIINRSRVRAGIRSVDPHTRQSLLVLCGGPVAGLLPEAAIMADFARICGFTGTIVLETESRSTEENIANAIPLIEDADRIKIVSDSMHAEFGRAFLRRQRPDLAARLVRGKDYRLGESLFIKPIAALIALRSRKRLSPSGRHARR
ncbi:YdcF family protein [Paramicrobacterium sp. CJ85]|uniref:YdcF family protein n=1 Tax=Paramicrobacterium sp. CJ85 TaxID=3445355 RepID=UPI003F6141D3